jgi:prefoldin subunit 4
MLAAEEENEAEVRRVDQDNINQFARLNARLHDAQNERERLKVRYCMYTAIYLSLLTC